MRREEAKARKDGLRQRFYAWCDKHKKDLTPRSFIDFDEQDGHVWLDHDKARKDGYYCHLLQQATAIINQWATIEPLRPNAGEKTPYFEVALAQRDSIALQAKYQVNGRTYSTEKIVRDSALLKALLADFQKYIQNKTMRQYLLLQKHEEITGVTRQKFLDVMRIAEENAYNRIKKD